MATHDRVASEKNLARVASKVCRMRGFDIVRSRCVLACSGEVAHPSAKKKVCASRAHMSTCFRADRWCFGGVSSGRDTCPLDANTMPRIASSIAEGHEFATRAGTLFLSVDYVRQTSANAFVFVLWMGSCITSFWFGAPCLSALIGSNRSKISTCGGTRFDLGWTGVFPVALSELDQSGSLRCVRVHFRRGGATSSVGPRWPSNLLSTTRTPFHARHARRPTKHAEHVASQKHSLELFRFESGAPGRTKNCVERAMSDDARRSRDTNTTPN